jgi:hypothetical protein
MTPIISALALARVGPVNVFLFMMSFGPRAAKTYRSRAHRLRRGIWIRSTTVISTPAALAASSSCLDNR